MRADQGPRSLETGILFPASRRQDGRAGDPVGREVGERSPGVAEVVPGCRDPQVVVGGEREGCAEPGTR